MTDVDKIIRQKRNKKDWKKPESPTVKSISSFQVDNVAIRNARKEKVKNMNNESDLAKIANNDFNEEIRKEATKKITDEDILLDIAINNSMVSVCREAIKNIHNELVLSEVAKSDTDFLTRNDALKKIHNIDILKDIANNASVEYTRNKAKERLPEKPKTNNQNKKKTIKSIIATPLKKNNPSENLNLSEKLHKKLKKCPQCNNTLSKIVKKCPYCNHVFKIQIDEIIRQKRNKKYWKKPAPSTINIISHFTVNKKSIRNAREENIKYMTNESDLAKIAINGSMSSIRREAVKKIHNELVLSEVAKSDTDFLTRNDALKKIHNIDILKDIANNASVEYTRNKAKERLPEKPKTNNQNKKKTIRPMGSGPLKTDNPSQNPYLSEKLHEKLKKCPLCNNTLSKIVKKCPYCGYDFNNPKKIFEQKSTVKWQYCTECGHRLNKVAKKCPYCNKILE